MRIEELPPKLRAEVKRQIAADQISAPAPRLPRPAPPSTQNVSRPRRPLHRCATCGETFTSWAPAERCADTHGGARIEWLGI